MPSNREILEKLSDGPILGSVDWRRLPDAQPMSPAAEIRLRDAFRAFDEIGASLILPSMASNAVLYRPYEAE